MQKESFFLNMNLLFKTNKNTFHSIFSGQQSFCTVATLTEKWS